MEVGNLTVMKNWEAQQRKRHGWFPLRRLRSSLGSVVVWLGPVVGTLLFLEHTPEVAGESHCLAVCEKGFLSLHSAMKRHSKSLRGRW